MEPWNDPGVQPPSVNTILYPCSIDMRDVMHGCKNAIKLLTKQSPLHKESALLSRFIYKFDRKFRNDIGYRLLKKINTALRRYLSLNLLGDIQSFLSVIPCNNDDEKYFPTRQMLEYVLVRIMSFSKIMMRICVCSKQASVYYLNRVKRGESHWMSLMPYALLSRIWSISTLLLQYGCSWFKTFYPLLESLQSKGVPFLPTEYHIPSDIEEWLDIKNIDNYGRFQWSYRKSIQVKLNIADDDPSIDTILEYVKDINNEKKDEIDADLVSIKPHVEPILQISIDKGQMDTGISVSREYFKSFYNNQNVNMDMKCKQIHSADNVTNKISLDEFLSQEENYRNESSKLSLTSHLSFMQWQALKKSLDNLSQSLAKNRKIERKFKEIWQQKCLDYI